MEALAPADLPVRYLLPDAPERPITINMGYRMRGLGRHQELRGSGRDCGVPCQGSQRPVCIAAPIDRWWPRVRPERIVLAGPLGGVIASPSPPCAIQCHWQACSACPPTWLRPTPCPAK